MKKKRYIIYIILILGSIPFLFPFWRLVSGSLKEKERFFIYPPDPVPVRVKYYAKINGIWKEVRVLANPSELKNEPEHINDYKVKILDNEEVQWVKKENFKKKKKLYLRWKNFSDAWTKAMFGRYLINSAFVSLMTILGTIISCSLVGYAFARLRFVGKNILFMIILATLMLPSQITLIPTFIIFKTLGWIDTFKPLFVPHWFASAAGSSAFFVFLFRQFFMTIPLDLEDAAKIDGCSPLMTYWHIILPLAKPVVITVAIYSFMWSWNDLINPLIYLNSEYKRTLTLGLANFIGTYSYLEPTQLLAASFMMIIPTIAIFFVAQKALMEGMKISGGIKG